MEQLAGAPPSPATGFSMPALGATGALTALGPLVARGLPEPRTEPWVLRRARPEDLLWDRSGIDLPHKLGVTIVYGHTPDPGFGVRWNLPFSIGIDTGAVYGGRLTAIRLPDETLFQV